MSRYLIPCLLSLLAVLSTVSGQPANRIKQPYAGQVVLAGHDFLISWDAAVKSTNISLTLKKGNSTNNHLVVTIAKGIPNTGGYWWPVNSTIPPGDDYIIQLSVDNTTNSTDTFSGQFTISDNSGQETGGAGPAGVPASTATNTGAQLSSTTTASSTVAPTSPPDHGRTRRLAGIIVGSIVGPIIIFAALICLLYQPDASRNRFRRNKSQGPPKTRHDPGSRTMTTATRESGDVEGGIQPGPPSPPLSDHRNGSQESVLNPGSPDNTHVLITEEFSSTVPPSQSAQIPNEAEVSDETEGSVHLHFDDETGLYRLLLEHEQEFYEEIKKLKGCGFALGLDIFPYDGHLADESQRRYFTGETEMLWVQYEDTPRATVTKVVEKIAEYIRPYAVTAFEDGPSGREMIVNCLGDSVNNPESGDVYDSRNVAHHDESGQNSGGDNRTTGGPSNAGVGDGDNATDPQRQDDDGSNETNQNQRNEDNEPPKGTAQAQEVRGDNERKRRYVRFTGELRAETKLHTDHALCTIFDLSIDHTPDPHSLHIQLEQIVVAVSTVEAIDPPRKPCFIIAKVEIQVAQSGSLCNPPTNGRPIEADFFEVGDTTTSKIYGLDSTISWEPKLTGHFARGKLETRRKKPITEHFMLEKLDLTPGCKGLRWQYQIFPPSDKYLQISSDVFRTTDATFPFSHSEPPNCIKIMVRASYTRKWKLPLFNGRLRSDAGIIHVQTQFDVDVGKGNDWFLLPGNDDVNKNCRLKAVLNLDDNKLTGEEQKEITNVISRWNAGKWPRPKNGNN